ncbi:MAG: response regulator transcription factor [Bacteroidetes bacterium]|nr:response regulator transcription factor [Bacteroidota bacterium]MBT3750489.1 response regulator transcription factor [Bacteroidota bacterium]MBT4399855.1 response regulator transcription factor [Bacteroidota bacterium]MBT4410765.1 response regulator transcription factor [Bacteroidota bacterium]MBT5427610.1 response regulator transcription factor [Bacteroidota bacterium]
MIKSIAIDDEAPALRQMGAYIEKTPFLELVGSFNSALEAITFLDDHMVDLIFVDIQMPDLSGMDFVKSLDPKPMIVFTTAYSEYAVEGFKVDAVDYLLKPIAYLDFLKSAGKAHKQYEAKMADNKVSHDKEHLFVKSEYRLIRINFSDIQYIEGMREYVRIHLLSDKPVMSLLSMKSLEEQLPGDRFMRVHRSFIVNLSEIKIVERSRIVFGDKYIPVAEQYKEQFQKYVDSNFLKK